MPEEELETAELKEHIDERLEEHEEHGRGHATQPAWIRYLSLSTAIIAVFAAVAALMSGARSNKAILEKSEAMLAEARASDQWAYFQAKGMKAALAEGVAQILADSKPELSAKFISEAKRYREESEKIQEEAKQREEDVAKSNERSEELMEHHHDFAIAVTLLQIAIALSAIAALTRRRPLWFVGLAVSAAGLAMFLYGMR
ncbi:MAG TPA: DUF4337 family protein [Kofleriaceae bacterium]|nr:DUF4337 family protein [Kofleriaceae bacterium]